MVFSDIPYGSVDQITNPKCGKHKGSEVHFFINVLKYPTTINDGGMKCKYVHL